MLVYRSIYIFKILIPVVIRKFTIVYNFEILDITILLSVNSHGGLMTWGEKYWDSFVYMLWIVPFWATMHML